MALRRATLADAPGIARVHVLSWQATYPGILPLAEIERHTLADRVSNWHRMLLAPSAPSIIWVAVRGDAVIGFASGGAFRVEKPNPGAADAASVLSSDLDPGNSDGRGDGQVVHPVDCQNDGRSDGELNALYLIPELQGQGIGRQLFDACARGLHAAGFGAMRCWVLQGNPAAGFYARLGGVRVATKPYLAEGATVLEDCFRFALLSAAGPAQMALFDPSEPATQSSQSLACTAAPAAFTPPSTQRCL